MLMLKGAPDRVIGMCSTVYHQNKIINIDNVKYFCLINFRI